MSEEFSAEVRIGDPPEAETVPEVGRAFCEEAQTVSREATEGMRRPAAAHFFTFFRQKLSPFHPFHPIFGPRLWPYQQVHFNKITDFAKLPTFPLARKSPQRHNTER